MGGRPQQWRARSGRSVARTDIGLCDKRLALSRDLIDPTFTEGKLPKAPSHWPTPPSAGSYFLRGICNNQCFYRVNMPLFQKNSQNQPKKCRPHRVFHWKMLQIPWFGREKCFKNAAKSSENAALLAKTSYFTGSQGYFFHDF